MQNYAIVLAAGIGSRMKVDVPKCLHTIIKKPMIQYIIESVDKVALNIVGKTNRAMVNSAEARAENARAHHYAGQNGYVNTKKKRVKRFESKQHHSHKPEHERHERKRELPIHEKQYGEEE